MGQIGSLDSPVTVTDSCLGTPTNATIVPPYSDSGGHWISPIGDSQWDSVNAGSHGCDATYQATFTLPADAISPSLSVTELADNSTNVSLNGNQPFITGNVRGQCVTAYDGPPVSDTTTSGLVPGVNTLKFNVDNCYSAFGQNPTGLDFIATITYSAGTAPSPPQNVAVTPHNGSASLQWQPPAKPGSSPITGYVLTATPYANFDYYATPQVVTTTVPGTGSGPQIGTITGLLMDCHQEYSFTVSAVNAGGAGPPSAYGTAFLPKQPSPPDATGSPPHFRTSGVVAQRNNQPPVVVVTVEGFGAQYFLDNSGNPKTTTVDPLVGVNSSGVQQVNSSGDGLPISYCMEGEQRGARPNANASVPTAIWAVDEHFDLPGFDPGFLNNAGQYVDTHHYLLDQVIEGGGVALPYSYTSAAALSVSPAGVPRFRFTGYTQDKSITQDPNKDVTLLAKEVNSIHMAWPDSRIVLVGHSGGGLVVEQYWQKYGYSAQNVKLVVSIEGPINGIWGASTCSPHCDAHFGFGGKVLNVLGQLWDNQESNDAAIAQRDGDESFVAISTEGDSAYGSPQNGDFDSIVPDSVFPCGVSAGDSCVPLAPPSFVDGGLFGQYDPCQWSSALQQALAGEDLSHAYAIGCPENAEYIRSVFSP